jgi:hypothetical protein
VYVSSCPTATLRQAQGDKHSEYSSVIALTTTITKLFKILVYVVKKQNDIKVIKTACHPEPGEGLL